MELRLEDGLLLATSAITYNRMRMIFNNVLLDTGCAASVFDIDLMESMGFKPDCKTARIVKMYGVGGSEACIEQRIYDFGIDDHQFTAVTLQFGDIRTRYGFGAILGNDIMSACGLMLDLLHLVIRQHQPTCLPLFH